MAIKLLTNKRIIKYDDKNPNFIPQKEDEKKPVVNGNIKEEDGQTEKTIINETVARAGSITKDVIINPSKKYTWSIVKESAGDGNPLFKNLSIDGKGVLPLMGDEDESTGTFEKINSDVNMVGTIYNAEGGGGGD